MDVINFRGGDGRPSTDPILEAVANVARAGVRSSPPATIATTSASAPSARPASPRRRSPSPRSRTRMSTRRRSRARAGCARVAAVDPDGRGVRVAGRRAADARRRDDDHGHERSARRVAPLRPRRRPERPDVEPAAARIADRHRRRIARRLRSSRSRSLGRGAAGMILVDNRFGEANAIPSASPIPAGMIADVDGERLRGYMSQTGGRTIVRADRAPTEIVTGRSGVIELLVGGAHELRPRAQAGRRGARRSDRSSTPPESAGGGNPFAVFDRTSMAAPHVTGAAALLLQSHPSWTPRQMRSAFVSTAAAAWATRRHRARRPVVLEGRPRGRRARRRSSALHRAGLALVRGPRREPRRAVACARGAARRRGRKARHVVGRPPAAVDQARQSG